MEFKGTKRANEYCNSIEERNPYEDYLNGYNQALKDSKASEMLEMLEYLYSKFEGEEFPDYDDYEDINRIIKQATEL